MKQVEVASGREAREAPENMRRVRIDIPDWHLGILDPGEYGRDKKIKIKEDENGEIKLVQDLYFISYTQEDGNDEAIKKLKEEFGISATTEYYDSQSELRTCISKDEINKAFENSNLVIFQVDEDSFEIA